MTFRQRASMGYSGKIRPDIHPQILCSMGVVAKVNKLYDYYRRRHISF